MIHKINRELGIAIDSAIEEFTLEGVLDVPSHFAKWANKCEPLNDTSTYQLAKYLIEGYDYPKSKEELIEVFVEWLADYNNHIPYPTSNSGYRRGRRNTLEEIQKRMSELGLIR